MFQNNRREIAIGVIVVLLIALWLAWYRWDQTPSFERIAIVSRAMGFYLCCGGPPLWFGAGWALRARRDSARQMSKDL